MRKAIAPLALAATALLAGNAIAGRVSVVDYGTSPTAYVQNDLDIFPYPTVWYNTTHVTNAVGIRNRRGGGIELNGAPDDVRGAEAVIMHWSFTGIDDPDQPGLDKMWISRMEPPYTKVLIDGTIVGESHVNCWEIRSRARVYRAILSPDEMEALKFDVKVSGSFAVWTVYGTTPLTQGRDPWLREGYDDDLSAVDGVALTAIYRSDREPMGATFLYDEEHGSGRALAGKLFNLEASYTLHGLNVAGIDDSKFSFLSFGGQDRKAGLTQGMGEVTRLNGNFAQGNSALAQRLFDGAQGSWSPQLIDARSFTQELSAGTSDVLVEIAGDRDCIVPGAVVVTAR